MCKLKKILGNKTLKKKGSTTVEMCIIMPIILSLLVLFIFLFLSGANEGIVQGSTYMTLYTYELTGNMIEKEGILQGETQILGEKMAWEIKLYMKKGNVYAKAQKLGERDRIYGTEYGLCTSRLRRWQLYGDILWE